MKQTANVLLTRDEISQLNGGALGYIPDNVRERLTKVIQHMSYA